MTLEELYYISQIAAVFAILGSLAAVYWQVRQTNMVARAELTHSANLQASQLQMSLYDTPEKADLMYRALSGAGPLSDSERARVNVAMAVVFGIHQTAFDLRQRDLIEPGAYNGLEALVRLYLRSQHAQGYWKRHRNEGKDARYVALLDGMIVEIEDARASKAMSTEPTP
jgi:hypothetical protein